LSTAVTAPRPRLYSLSAQRGASMSPTSEGQRVYHPTLSSPVTRRIWGSPDTILLFFAGGAAEFAAIEAVDWLFFTGRLPGAPVERFFEPVRFAQGVFFGTNLPDLRPLWLAKTGNRRGTAKGGRYAGAASR
jgi:hypothetical protein